MNLDLSEIQHASLEELRAIWRRHYGPPWAVHRIASIEDAGTLVGTYRQRRDATKALAAVAYQLEPW